MATQTEPRIPLSRERVLQAAIELADEGGIEALTMRKLARALGVEAMSLYNHVANKGDLVDGIVDLVISEVELPASAETWDVAVREYAIAAREAFLRHPWACSPMMGLGSTGAPHEPRLRYMEWLLRSLREAGFSPGLTYHAYHTVDSHILGFTLWQLGHSAAAKGATEQQIADFTSAFIPRLRADGYEYLAEHAEQHMAKPEDDEVDEFEFALDLILAGLRRAHEER